MDTRDINGNSSYASVEATLKLMIRDLYVKDGHLKFTVFAKQAEPVFIRGADQVPNISKRSVMTTVQIPNGETIVLGGLINKKREKTTRGIPILSKLPFIGRVFKSDSTKVTEDELVILLTPQISGKDVDLGGKKKYETIPVPRRSDRLEKLHSIFQRIKGSHFPQNNTR